MIPRMISLAIYIHTIAKHHCQLALCSFPRLYFSSTYYGYVRWPILAFDLYSIYFDNCNILPCGSIYCTPVSSPSFHHPNNEFIRALMSQESSINSQHVTRHKGSILRSQKQRSPRSLIACPQSRAERMLLYKLCVCCANYRIAAIGVKIEASQRGFDVTGCDCIDVTEGTVVSCVFLL